MVGGVEELSIEQLASSISTYKEQLEQVRSRSMGKITIKKGKN